MKKFSFLILSILLIASCSSNGLKKSITEPLSVDELKANIKKDTTFTDFYSEIQKIREWIIGNDVRQAKYGDITYKQLKRYDKHGRDTTFFNKKGEGWKEEYAKLYPSYDTQLDSIITYWKAYKEQYNMDSLVVIEYDKLWKEYYSYIGGIKDVNIGFRITPLKGKIDQLIFRYEMRTKVSNDGSSSSSSYSSIWNTHRCVATSPITKPTTLYWEADYSDEKKLEGRSSEDVKRDYDFIIELVNVRINGENYEDKLNLIPESVSHYLRWENDEFMQDLYKDDIIQELINKDYKTYYEYSRPLIEAEMKSYDPDVYALVEEYSNYDEDDD